MKICPACRFDRCDDTAESCRQCGADLTVVEEQRRITAAWFHYLKIPAIGTIELTPGKAFSMGREWRNDLVIPTKGEKVAEVFWTDGYAEATVRELGAPEAVKVEGVRIKGSRTLKGGEEIEVGPLRMNYLKTGKPVPGAKNPAKLKRGAGTANEASRAVSAPSRTKAGGSGFLEPHARKLKGPPPPSRGRPQPRPAPAGRKKAGATPAEICLALEKTRSTGTVQVRADQQRGWVSIKSGRPVQASYGGLKGEKALDAILRLRDATAHFNDGPPRRGTGPEIQMTFKQASARIRPATRQAARPARPPVRPPARKPPPSGRGGAPPPPRPPGRPRRGR